MASGPISSQQIDGETVETLTDLILGAPRDEAGLTTTFQTWPRGCFHVAKHPDFPVPS